MEKARSRHFSFRYLARICGFGSSGFLKMVMEGQRNLSPSSINKLTKALKLNEKEAVYFETLTFFNQSDAKKDKELYLERLSHLKASMKGKEKFALFDEAPSFSFSISKKNVEEIKAKIKNFREEIVSLVNQENGNNSDAYQLNVLLLPATP